MVCIAPARRCHVLRLAEDAYPIGGGAVYLALWIHGVIINQASLANFVPLNTADNWLHLVLGIGMIGLGIALARSVPRTDTSRPASPSMP